MIKSIFRLIVILMPLFIGYGIYYLIAVQTNVLISIIELWKVNIDDLILTVEVLIVIFIIELFISILMRSILIHYTDGCSSTKLTQYLKVYFKSIFFTLIFLSIIAYLLHGYNNEDSWLVILEGMVIHSCVAVVFMYIMIVASSVVSIKKSFKFENCY